MFRMKARCLPLVLLALLLAACGGAPPYTGGDVAELQRIDLTTGQGAAAATGDEVSVHYTGWLYDQDAPASADASSTARATAANRSCFRSARAG
jgi:ABC-type glycerol-3-phosphate transport system substrate-binding protein